MIYAKPRFSKKILDLQVEISLLSIPQYAIAQLPKILESY